MCMCCRVSLLHFVIMLMVSCVFVYANPLSWLLDCAMFSGFITSLGILSFSFMSLEFCAPNMLLVKLVIVFFKCRILWIFLLNEWYSVLCSWPHFLLQVPTPGIDLNSVCTRELSTSTVPQMLLNRLPLSPLNLVSRLRLPLQMLDLDPHF